MKAAMCYTKLLLATLVLFAWGRKIEIDQLPDVVPAPEVKTHTDSADKNVPDALLDKDIMLPPKAPKPTLGGDDEGPLMLNDVEDKHEQARLVFSWCVTYGYADDTDISDMTTEEIVKTAEGCIKRSKAFYKIEEEPTGELTEELLIQMSQPRCAKHDDKDNDEDEHARKKRWNRMGSITWDKFPLTIKFRNYHSSLSQSEQDSIAKHCARLWAEDSGVSFDFRGRGNDGNIDIRFEYIDGAWNTVGQGLSPVTWGDRSSYLKLDSSERWKARSTDSGFGVSMTWALCHEMGHNLGLGHSNDRTAIMYPSGIGQDENKLGYDDKVGIQTLYGRSDGRTLTSGGSPSYPPPAPAPQPTRRTTYRPTYRPTQRTTYRPTQRTTYRTSQPTRQPTYRTYTRSTSRRTPPSNYRYRLPPAGHIPNYRPTNWY